MTTPTMFPTIDELSEIAASKVDAASATSVSDEEYRAYIMSRDGHIVKANGFIAANDGAASKHAQQFVDGCAVEVWSGVRLVAKLPPV
jgi:hypothetical protein